MELVHEAIGMRLSLLVLAFAAVIVISGMGFAIDVANCADGTPYNGCSTKSPGYWCHGLINAPTLENYPTKCPCTNQPGWVQEGEGDNAKCIQAKCDDGTKVGECATTKPKVCVGGSTYTDNATKCGCPAGMKPSSVGIICEYEPCSDGTKDGLCSTKSVGKKCVQSALVDKASECPCKSGYIKQGEACVLECTANDGSKVLSGQCSLTKPKYCNENGYLVDDASKCGCPESQVADSSGKRCVASSLLGGLGGSDVLGAPSGGSANATGAGGSSGLGSLQCCCLPTALIGLAGGFVYFRKKK